MKQMDVFKKIGGILQELNDQYDYLKADSSDLNELELELFVANAHFLKDHAEILRRIHERKNPAAEKVEPIAENIKPVLGKIPESDQEPIHERRFFEPVVQQKSVNDVKPDLVKEIQPSIQVIQYKSVEPELPAAVEVPFTETIAEEPYIASIDLGSGSTGDSYSFERQEPEINQEELILNEANETEEVAETLKDIHTQPVVIIPEAEPELFKPMLPQASQKAEDNKILTFNQKISAQKSEGNNHRPTAELPITDLKSAINLNDKLLYIKDLFNGYSLAYSEAIEIVNRFNTFEEAERFLKTNYLAKNNWEGKPATSEKFYALLRRRYPTV